jgi:hypothetical protein
MKAITLGFKNHDEQATAILLEKEAPVTCDTFWKNLPIEHEAVHSSWSGECILVVPCGVEVPEGERGENETIFVGPGEIALFTPVQELLVFYGRGQPRWRSGPTPSTVFARIIDGLEKFASICQTMPKEGSKTMIIQRKE